MSPEYGNKSFLFVYIWHQLCFVLAIVIPFHKEDLSINQSINQSLVSLINTQFLSKAFHLTKILMVINFHILLTRISSKCFLQIKSSKCKSGKHFPNMKQSIYLSGQLYLQSYSGKYLEHPTNYCMTCLHSLVILTHLTALLSNHI